MEETFPSADHAGLVSAEGGREYAERAAHPSAAQFASRVWTCRFDASCAGDIRAHRVLPDACVEVVNYRSEPNTLRVFGPSSCAYDVDLPCTEWAVGVRLRVGAAQWITGCLPGDLRDREIRQSIEQRPTNDPDEAARWLEGVLKTTCEPCPPVREDLLTLARKLAFDADVRVAIAEAVAYSERQVRRDFARQIGLPPKRFARVQRLWRVLHRKRAAPRLTWGMIAQDAGFADHAHLDTEFVALTKMTPSEWWSRFQK